MLLDKDIRNDIISVGNRPIYTKVRNSPPTIYREGSAVKNSYVADGCDIEGVVENSIIFRDVRIGKGCVVRNSILLQGNYVGEGVSLNCVVADKDVIIKNGRMLSGHMSTPFFIAKGTVV
jgi:glucose-1-phosphate adenylyltransferase